MLRGTAGKAVVVFLNEHASASLDVALHLILVLVVGAGSVAGVILRVIPDILGTLADAVGLEVEVARLAGQARELARALQAGRRAVQALFIVEQVGLRRALHIARTVVDVAIQTLSAVSFIEALVAVVGARLAGTLIGGVVHERTVIKAEPIVQEQLGLALGTAVVLGAGHALRRALKASGVVGEGAAARIVTVLTLLHAHPARVHKVPVHAL